MHDEEIWKDIEGLEGLYQVSNHGRFRSLDRLVNNKHGTKTHVKGGIRKPTMVKGWHPSGGWPSVSFSVEGKQQHGQLHELVFKAFVGPIPEGYNILFLDGNHYNCRVDNLSCAQSHKYGVGQHAAKLDNDKVRLIREKIATEGKGISNKLAEEFGVNKNVICKIKHRRIWSTVDPKVGDLHLSTVSAKKRLTLQHADEIKKILATKHETGITHQQIADRYGVSTTTIRRINGNLERFSKRS